MILMHFLYKQGGFDKNSIGYLRKIQRSLGVKDAKSNKLIIFNQSLKRKLNTLNCLFFTRYSQL